MNLKKAQQRRRSPAAGRRSPAAVGCSDGADGARRNRNAPRLIASSLAGQDSTGSTAVFKFSNADATFNDARHGTFRESI